MQPPDPNSGRIMSIRFTICSFVSLLLLIFNYRLSRHDGITCIVSTSHGPLCTRLILFSSHLHFLAAALAHLRPFYFSGSYVRFFSFGFFCLLLAFSFCLSHLVTVHINSNQHDISCPFLTYPFPLFLSLLILALSQGLSLYTYRPSFDPGRRSFSWCNTISPYWDDHLSPMLMLLYSLRVRNFEELDRCRWRKFKAVLSCSDRQGCGAATWGPAAGTRR